MTAADGLLAAYAGPVVADDLELLAMLHDRELDAAMLAQLRTVQFPENLAFRLVGAPAREALTALRSSLAELEQKCTADRLDALAADYAAIYLTHALRASPEESVWLDEEHLAMQAPMFAVRAWMARHGLAVPNWRRRPDDHLVHQLLFLAHLFRQASESGQVVSDEIAAFMDGHLLRWIHDFTRRVAARCATPFYAALALLTSNYLEELREFVAALLGVPRLSLDADPPLDDRPGEATAGPRSEAFPRFVPGSAPSW